MLIFLMIWQQRVVDVGAPDCLEHERGVQAESVMWRRPQIMSC